MVLTEKQREAKRQANYAYYRKARIGTFSHRWTQEEDALVFNRQLTDREISKLTKHSLKAVQTRRGRLKKYLNK